MSDDAEEAFDLLRGEVALLRRAVEGFLADPVKIPPEVSRQMRAQSAELKRLADETQRLAGSPALDISIEDHKRAIEKLVDSIAKGAREPWNTTLADLRGVGAEFARYGERARLQDAQYRQLAVAAVVGGFAAVAVWLGLSGPIARALPERWQIAERMAAATLDLDRSLAGRSLMAKADPDDWRVHQQARELFDLNNQALDRCVRGKSAPTKSSTCLIVLPASWTRERE